MTLEWHPKIAGPMPWVEAMKYCESLGNGWRPPTITELCSTIDWSKYDPATKIARFLSSRYWSSTTYVIFDDHAWYTNFFHGAVDCYDKSGTCYVRAVRDA